MVFDTTYNQSFTLRSSFVGKNVFPLSDFTDFVHSTVAGSDLVKDANCTLQFELNTTAPDMCKFIESATGYAAKERVYISHTECNVSSPLGTSQTLFNLITSETFRLRLSDRANAPVRVVPESEFVNVYISADTNVTRLVESYMKMRNGTATLTASRRMFDILSAASKGTPLAFIITISVLFVLMCAIFAACVVVRRRKVAERGGQPAAPSIVRRKRIVL